MELSCKQIDNAFGPDAGHCRGGLDFTLFFEESILSILPLCVLLCLIPVRILYLIRRSIKVNDSLLAPAKLVSLQQQ